MLRMAPGAILQVKILAYDGQFIFVGKLFEADGAVTFQMV